MTHYGDYFKDIDFDKPWSERDWERFFEAQDRMVREAETRLSRRSGNRAENALSFREVLRRFGMDPDRVGSDVQDYGEPEDPSRIKGSAGISSSDFYRDGFDLQRLPVYCDARSFIFNLVNISERYFGQMLRKVYRSQSHRRLQEVLIELNRRSVAIPGLLAAGHALGYDRESISGNVVRCRKALQFADDCLGLLSRLPSRRLPPGEYRKLFQENLRLRNHLIDWISYLRLRFSRREC